MIASLVMPSYGQAAHIYDAVSSILKQDVAAPFELVIVFGGAEARATEEVGHALLEHYPSPCEVTMHYTRGNTTAGDAINRGFARCQRSPFWGWVSSDNELEPEFLRFAIRHLRSHLQVDAVYASYQLEEGYANGKTWLVGRSDTVRPQNIGLIRSPNCYIGPAHLHRRELWDRVGPHKTEHAHDYDWWLRAEEVGRIEHLNEVLATLRVHQDRANVRHGRDGSADGERWRQEALKRRGIA